MKNNAQTPQIALHDLKQEITDAIIPMAKQAIHIFDSEFKEEYIHLKEEVAKFEKSERKKYSRLSPEELRIVRMINEFRFSKYTAGYADQSKYWESANKAVRDYVKLDEAKHKRLWELMHLDFEIGERVEHSLGNAKEIFFMTGLSHSYTEAKLEVKTHKYFFDLLKADKLRVEFLEPVSMLFGLVRRQRVRYATFPVSLRT